MKSILKAFGYERVDVSARFRVSPRRALFFAGLFIALSSRSAVADESTGLAHDDPKDMEPAAPVHVEKQDVCSNFTPLPRWSSYHAMPPLPDQLKPLGKKEKVAAAAADAREPASTASATAPTPPPLAPPVEIPAPAKAPAPAPVDTGPILIAVSPFLQWIKDHPKDAVAEAQKQANIYRAGSGPTNPGDAPGNPDPYWMPPLSDSNVQTTTSGSSAAIYSTPQRN